MKLPDEELIRISIHRNMELRRRESEPTVVDDVIDIFADLLQTCDSTQEALIEIVKLKEFLMYESRLRRRSEEDTYE